MTTAVGDGLGSGLDGEQLGVPDSLCVDTAVVSSSSLVSKICKACSSADIHGWPLVCAGSITLDMTQYEAIDLHVALRQHQGSSDSSTVSSRLGDAMCYLSCS